MISAQNSSTPSLDKIFWKDNLHESKIIQPKNLSKMSEELKDEMRRLAVEAAVFKRLDKRREEKSAKYAINQGQILLHFLLQLLSWF